MAPGGARKEFQGRQACVGVAHGGAERAGWVPECGRGGVGMPARGQVVPWAVRGDAIDEMMGSQCAKCAHAHVFPKRRLKDVLTLTLFPKDV